MLLKIKRIVRRSEYIVYLKRKRLDIGCKNCTYDSQLLCTKIKLTKEKFLVDICDKYNECYSDEDMYTYYQVNYYHVIQKK